MAGRDSPGSGSGSGSTISRGEVAQRADADGQPVLFIIDNEVYDVTPFLDEHPGGHEVLQNMAGRDASEDFADVGHSADAKEMMRKYHVGAVPEAERRAAAARTARWEEPAAAAPAQSAAWKLPLVLALAATLLYYLLLE